MRLNAREWWLILLGVVGAGIQAAIFPVFAIFFGEVLRVFTLPSLDVFEAVHLWAGLALMVGVVSSIANFMKTLCFALSGEKLIFRLRSLSFRSMLRQEVSWFDQQRNSTGALTAKLANDTAQVQGATGSRLGTMVEVFIGMLVALLIALEGSWVLTLVILLVVPLVLVVAFLQVFVFTGQANAYKKSVERAGEIAVDSIENIQTVTALSVEHRFFEMYKDEVSVPYRKALKNSVIYGLTYGISQAIVLIAFAVTFYFGAYQLIQPEDHIIYARFEDIYQVFIALIFGALAVGQAGSFAPNYTKAKLSAKRIFSLLDKKPSIDNFSKAGLKPEDRSSGQIEIQNIHFSYPTRQDIEVLKGVNLSIPTGKTYALVGGSGCGKTTLMSLIERFYDPDDGSFLLDGSDFRALNVRWLRSQIGIVFQKPVLFDASVSDNIRYGANFREVTDEEVIKAAQTANIHNFVQSLPEGYSTNVGAGGAQLSGGQKQCIAIARALVRDPAVLLLDEATSALDTENEKLVQQALEHACEGRTSIMIAHRLSTVYGADCIAVVSEGKIVEKGTHAELVEKKGIYYKLNLYQTQLKD